LNLETELASVVSCFTVTPGEIISSFGASSDFLAFGSESSATPIFSFLASSLTLAKEEMPLKMKKVRSDMVSLVFRIVKLSEKYENEEIGLLSD
jgi:hypothetical protein